MELTVYRQSSKQRPDGTIVYKGEDALPYVDDKTLLIADGLGGAAAIRHQKIVPDLFDKDKLMDTLFSGVYDDYSDERFVSYVTDSFFELFAVKDCYTENVNNIKKSGYFASRIVTAIVLHMMLYDEGLNPDYLFDKYGQLQTQELKDDFAKKLGEFFAVGIANDIRKIAKNANLIYESSYSGLALLGSTLCATIFREKDDFVEAFYITAGDSRPYIWTETDGLCQIIEDQEGQDGGMTNYIKANEGASFSIRCNYMHFKKPCVLFNASDGCFDSGYFLSPMAFEKLILDKAVSSNDTDSMGKELYETFLIYGKHDDSSTIAMKMFGYNDFNVFKDSALRRLKTINEDYISKMSDVLEHDYISEYDGVCNILPARLSGVKLRFEIIDEIKALCAQKMVNDNFPVYISEMQSIDEQINEANSKRRKSLICIEEVISNNYSRFLPFLAYKESWSERHMLSKINKTDLSHKRLSDDYVEQINHYRSEIEETSERMKIVIGQIFEIGVPSDFSDYDDISFSVVQECERSMDSVFHFFYSVRERKQGAIRRLSKLRKDYITQNRKLALDHKEEVNNLCEMIVSGALNLNDIQNQILQDDFVSLSNELAEIKDTDKRIEMLNTEERGRVYSECQELYWEENYVEIISIVVNDPAFPLTNELRAEAKAVLEDAQKQNDGVKEKSELQSSIFDQYMISYSRYLGGNE